MESKTAKSLATDNKTAPRWQRLLAEAIRTPEELLSVLGLAPSLLPGARQAAEQFPLLVPRGYVARMEYGNPRDPLLLQVLPLGVEAEPVPGFTLDAVGDQEARKAPGLLQKYTGRVLLITTGACAIHCRYCFRRHYPYSEEPHGTEAWQPALEAIQSDPEIHEVILSGGDPLLLTDGRLFQLIAEIEAIPHIRRLRFHTRLPIVLPERMHERLISRLNASRLTVIFVVHANHPRELQGECGTTLRTLVRSGFTVLNQAVLLRGINDDLETLTDLCAGLVDLGVMPYYLSQLDRVAGTAHFEVPEARGLELIAALRPRLPGYAVPRYVREIAGAEHKVPLE